MQKKCSVGRELSGGKVYLACGSDAFGAIGGTTRSQDAMLTIFPPRQLSKVPHAGRGRK